jgi:hypothetical protein
MRKIISIIFILSCMVYAHDQKLQRRAGTVSFVTSKNVYLKFETTGGLVKEDTVFTKRNGKIIPLAVVKFISSNSCAGEKIGSVDIAVGDAVFIMVPEVKPESIPKITSATEKDSNLTVSDNKVNKTAARQIKKERPDFYGSLNVNSFSNYANYPNSVGLQRYSYSLNLSAEKINGSSLSFSNYMYLSYLSNDWHDVRSNVFNNLKIFDLALNYSINGYNLWFGRHINYSVSNIGPVDGLQAEKKIDSFSLGAILGSRPDFYNMGINSKYFEYGIYVNRSDTINNGTIQNTVAYFEQTYQSKTDRRFLYFQHNNNIASNINIFASSEINLFKVQNNIESSDFSLTSLFLMTQFTPIRSISLNLSYDARRSVVYYQTFKSFIDSLFTNELRQGYRVSVFLRPVTGTFINLSSGYSYQKGDLKPSRNYNLSVTQTEIPILLISANLSFNRIFSNYQDGSIYSVTLSKFIPFNVTTFSVGFSNLKYNFGTSTPSLSQKEATVQITTRIFYSLFFNFYYEGDFDGNTTYGRFMTGFNYRF